MHWGGFWNKNRTRPPKYLNIYGLWGDSRSSRYRDGFGYSVLFCFVITLWACLNYWGKYLLQGKCFALQICPLRVFGLKCKCWWVNEGESCPRARECTNWAHLLQHLPLHVWHFRVKIWSKFAINPIYPSIQNMLCVACLPLSFINEGFIVLYVVVKSGWCRRSITSFLFPRILKFVLLSESWVAHTRVGPWV